MHTIVRAQAEAHFKQDLLYRQWAAGHGGVYVPVTDATPPNKYLTDTIGRDIKTQQGKSLTLLNPAYMTRQVHEIASMLDGVQGHITSLTPIRPENVADDWERNALLSFQSGDSVRFSLDSINHAPYFRLMKPLIADKSCIVCHQQQGYVEGDIRGGLSISVPAGQYLAIIKAKMNTSVLLHISVLSVMLILLVFIYKSISGKIKSDALVLSQLQKHTTILNAHNAQYQALNESLIVKNSEYRRLTDEYAEQNQVLDSALKKAEESDRLKTSFLSNMSHEIRTPMNGIVGFAQLLSIPGVEAEKQEQYLTILNDSCTQLLQIVNDILEISKIETNQIEVHEQLVYLPSLLANIAEAWRHKASARHNVISIIEPRDVEKLWVYADELKLTHLLGHLMSNAVKFTEYGSIALTCGIDGSQFFISVTDNGKGIAEELHPVIFERFRKGELLQSYDFGGTGLGLAICKGYADHMDGQIRLSSTEGHGSVFTYIQAYRPVEAEDIYVDAKVCADPIAGLQGKTILVAEDDLSNFIYINELLCNEGCTVLHAMNGKEAVVIASVNLSVDIVLMDINMPVMDGCEATLQIHALRPELPVIAHTAMFSEEEASHFAFAGFKTVISKPISQAGLISAIKLYV